VSKYLIINFLLFAGVNRGGGMKEGYREEGVPDMTVMSDINETGINSNLQLRYQHDNIYVSLYFIFRLETIRTSTSNYFNR
jgi:hypothetical protein